MVAASFAVALKLQHGKADCFQALLVCICASPRQTCLATGAARAVLAPKLGAATALAAAGAGAPLGATVLFSSVAALLGAPGQATYAAANGALEAWATAQAACGAPVAAVQWGAWGIGMAAGPISQRVDEDALLSTPCVPERWSAVPNCVVLLFSMLLLFFGKTNIFICVCVSCFFNTCVLCCRIFI